MRARTKLVASSLIAAGLISGPALAGGGVVTGTTPNWPAYTNRAEACSAAKQNARNGVSSRTNYYGKVTGFGKCDCDSETNDDGKNIHICTVDAEYERD